MSIAETPLDPNSFNAAYAVLRKNAEQLQRSSEPDIDALVPLVEQSMAAYRICKSRIDAVRKSISEQLDTPEDK